MANRHSVDRRDSISGYSIATMGAKLALLPSSAIQDVGVNNNTLATPRGRINIIAGGGMSVTGADNNAQNSKDVTVQVNTPINAQTGNYTVQTSDLGKLIRMTGTTAQTLTFPAVATLGTGFYCYVENANTGTTALTKTLTYTPNGTEKFDTAAHTYDYPGALRLVIAQGTAGAEFVTEVLRGGFIDIYNSDSPFTLNIPTQYTFARGEVWGSGGGGGAGGVAVGGTGGGGGSNNSADFRAGDLGTSQTITVGAGASAGGNGNATTFGSLISGYRGGAGQAGVVSDLGGGGASIFSNATGTSGSPPAGGTGGGGVSGTSGAAGSGNVFGGASGGGATTAVATAGGATFRGGRGGGSGGAISTQTTGGAGGGDITTGAQSGGGGSGGAPSGSSAAASDGAVVATTATPFGPGLGGGGGGGNTSTGNGGNGAAGGIASGGGGGGAAGTGTPGAGGAGGGGLARFTYR